jgi:hypothetical protein
VLISQTCTSQHAGARSQAQYARLSTSGFGLEPAHPGRTAGATAGLGAGLGIFTQGGAAFRAGTADLALADCQRLIHRAPSNAGELG